MKKNDWGAKVLTPGHIAKARFGIGGIKARSGGHSAVVARRFLPLPANEYRCNDYIGEVPAAGAGAEKKSA